MDSWPISFCRPNSVLKLFLLSWFLLATSWAGEAWFSASMPLGLRELPISVRIRIDTVDSYKGSHRVAARAIQGQTYRALLYSIETQYRDGDTTLLLHSLGLFRADGVRAAVWQNTVRSGLGDVEWSRRRFTETPARTEFHSLLYGDGSHTFEPDALPEEFLYLQATGLDQAHPHLELKVLASVWETPYSMGAWKAVANYTGTKLRIDGVDCYQVVFLRSDGASSEFYVSEGGRQVMRFKSFRGTWFSRFQ